MKASILYRTAGVLILLLDLGHTLGCPWSDPAWGVDLGPVRTAHFNVLGSSRTYWDFYVGFGLSVSVFLLLAAVLAWQLGGLARKGLPPMRATAWALALCFGALTALDLRYFFVVPTAFAAAITLCLVAAAWMERGPAGEGARPTT